MNVDNTRGHAWLLCNERLDQNDENNSVSAAAEHDLADIVVDPATSAIIKQIIDDIVLTFGDADLGQLVSMISQTFLDTPYQANTLIGSAGLTERLVANFGGVDCFTLLDYVCALARSHGEREFFTQLATIRYHAGEIDFMQRNHFFSDWFAREPANAIDITGELSPDVITVSKNLNRKGTDEEYIPGLGIVAREITYIPTEKINDDAVTRLNSGDLIGIYSKSQGLDVTHVGFLIKDPAGVYLRNASSLKANMKVVDSPLLEYLQNKLGIVVLRLRPSRI